MSLIQIAHCANHATTHHSIHIRVAVAVRSVGIEVAVAVEKFASISLPVHQIIVDSVSHVVAHLRRQIELRLQSAVIGIVVRWRSVVLALLGLLDSIVLAVITETAVVRLMLVRNR